MSSIQKLSDRLNEQFGFHITEFTRLYPGYWQRNVGAWSWMAWKIINGEKSMQIVGSQFPILELNKAPYISFNDVDGNIFPEEIEQIESATHTYPRKYKL